MSDKGRALVLGGGGVTGIAWEIGLVLGLAEAGVDLTGADLLIGTSAGSVVAARLADGTPLEELYAGQSHPPRDEISARLTTGMMLRYVTAYALPGTGQRKRARLGRAALRARTVSEAERRTVFEGRLAQRDWPERALRVTAVNAEDGSFAVFDRDSGAPFLDAVAASCAVPLVWPPVTIDGHRYMDGGMRSVANVDLAAGYGRVVVLAPITRALTRAGRPDVQLAALDARSILLSPDAAALKAIGGNVLDPARRAPAAEAGRTQAASVADAVREVWA
ncbi:patatin-like phospholipase family protein [Umezawaea endophytica]|uniref:Patatin-like phospholipase family protein n=1 Tax=Umezawaea endophytica TaxID=1654476 RepID=A0A9X3AF96_9PSEU|nr:patatin-like phospholipase family protein [Umezawaea endophytica]MCS7477976.1 patatin-like phospholipase family protein [Umezawaea endophytica]